MIKITQGIEGDDLPWHFNLLGITLPTDYYFVPLVNHYNTHTPEWVGLVEQYAKSANCLIFYDLIHTGDVEHSKYVEYIQQFSHPRKVYLTVNQQHFSIDGVKVVQWDFMWNRYKAYYTESIPDNLALHHCSRNYHQFDLNFTQKKLKLFLSPMGRDYGFRTALYNIVKDYNGYASNRSCGITLEEEPVVGIFEPIPAKFYLDSYFSVYVESNAFSTQLIHLTEKTFEPLTKGHFILPYANPGSIKRIKDLGFKLPDFIDYSYDNIEHSDKRFSRFIEEFKRLLTLDLDLLYKQNQNLLEYNKNCINTIPYDSRITEIFDV